MGIIFSRAYVAVNVIMYSGLYTLKATWHKGK